MRRGWKICFVHRGLGSSVCSVRCVHCILCDPLQQSRVPPGCSSAPTQDVIVACICKLFFSARAARDLPVEGFHRGYSAASNVFIGSDLGASSACWLLPSYPLDFIADVFKRSFPLDKWGAKTPPPTIHVYAFSRASDPEAELTEVRGDQ